MEIMPVRPWRFREMLHSSLPAVTAALILCTARALAQTSDQEDRAVVRLHDNWAMQSSCLTDAKGEQISAPGFAADGWHQVTVPTTVVAALVADGTFADPFVGINLRSLPGVSYPIGKMFANIAIPAESPFQCSWWYRIEFKTPRRDQNTWLHFDGINYRANIWLNGRRVADATTVAGPFRHFEFDVSGLMARGSLNALAVEISAPQPNDLALTFVDWNPMPPDKNMGLWRDVYLSTSGDVSLRHAFVQATLDARLSAAELRVFATLSNRSAHNVKGHLEVDFDGKHIEEPVELPPLAQTEVQLIAEKHPSLRLRHARLWWPAGMGTPELYTATLSFVANGRVSDSQTVRFGVRQVSTKLTREGFRLFEINGRPILIRRAGWASDMLQRWSLERMETELRYAQDIGLNTIRLEGQLERDEFFDICDHMGLLIMAGWTCCNAWERWSDWQKEQTEIARGSLTDQIRRLRNHPSLLVWLYGSDNPPPPDIETMYLSVLKEQHWPNPSLSSASQKPSTITGNSGVKMLGPYDYVPPNYWLTDKEAGGAFGFNTETSPGPAIPTLEGLQRFLPPGHLWPIDEQWNFHAGSGRFKTIEHFNEALRRRYGSPESLEDYLRKAEAMAYEGERAMFEAYTRNKYHATGVIQWMLNNAWPSLIWHLYDNFLIPAGGYFGTKKACESLHVQYSYDDRSVVVVSGRSTASSGLRVRAKILDLNARQLFARNAQLDVPADKVVTAFQLPSRLDGLTPVYFLQLELADRAGEIVSRNFYWLSTDPDILDWEKRIGTAYTPQSAFANLRGLAALPKTTVTVKASNGDTATTRVTLINAGADVAFMLRLSLLDEKDGVDVAPVFWQDNYVSLLPGESREIDINYRSVESRRTILQVKGWNVTARTIPVPLRRLHGRN
jgi:exo-1,4-beta-D-glucosaminidase